MTTAQMLCNTVPALRSPDEERLLPFFSQPLVLMCIGDRDGRLRCVNPAWQAMVATVAEPETSCFFEFIHPDDLPAAAEQLRHVTERGEPRSFECRVRGQQESPRWILWNICPQPPEQGFYAIGVEISARVRVEDELRTTLASVDAARQKAEAASRAKSDFLAAMSHDIRTPLTAIIGYADLLHFDGDLSQAPPRRVESIDTIRRAGHHLMEILDDILDLSKIEAGEMSLETIEMPLPHVLGEVVKLLRPRAAHKGIELAVRLETALPECVLGDPTRLRQILVNLIGNAIKFTDRGTVSLIVSARNDAAEKVLRFDVVDTGIGMTEEQSCRIFTPFKQADQSISRKHGGTGLGLNICRRLAFMMGGAVTLVRTAVGEGACFRLELPLHGVASAGMVNQISTPAVDTAKSTLADCVLSGNVLLAEDGPDNQRLIAFLLRKAGAVVDVADNGRIALEKIEAASAAGRQYDLILTDMEMPELDGYTLAATLRNGGCTTPIVALTAHAMVMDRQKCLDAGCDDYIPKPIEKHNLQRRCAQWLARRSKSVVTNEGKSNDSLELVLG